MEEVTSPSKSPRVRSISQLKTYSRCGELYRLERLERLGEFPAAWTVLGTAFHEAYEQWELAGRDLGFVDRFVVIYDNLIETLLEVQPDKRLWSSIPSWTWDKTRLHYRKRGIEKDIPQFEEHCLNDPDDVFRVEAPFEVDLDGVVVRGMIDVIKYDELEDCYLIEDIKTGNPKDEEDTRQLRFYGWVAREELGLDVQAARYWFTKLNRPGKYTSTTVDTREYWTENFRQLDKGISEGIFLPKPGENCGLCSVRKWCSFQSPGADLSTAPRKERKTV